MEEKNRASEMLNQMKRYIHSEKEASVEEKPDVKAEPISAEPDTAARKEERIRAIPTDDSLFEFDDITFDDVIIPEKPTLTPEEAVYAEELSEKFGVSKDAGVGFLDDTAAEDEKPRSFAPTAEEIASVKEESAHADVLSAIEETASVGEEAVLEIAGEVENVYAELSSQVSEAVDGIAQEAEVISSDLEQTLDEIAEPAYEAVNEAASEVRNIVDEALELCDDVQSAVEQSEPTVAKELDSIANEAVGVYSEISEEIDGAVDGIAAEVNEVAPDFEETLHEIADAVEGKIGQIISGLEEEIGEIAAEIEEFVSDKSVPVVKEEGEPDQVSFGIEAPAQPAVKSATTPTGVQMTFLDSFMQEEDGDIGGEQVVFGEEAEEQLEESELEAEDDIETEDYGEQPYDEAPAEIFEDVMELPEESALDDGDWQSAEEDGEDEEIVGEKAYQSPLAEELTPIEQSAIEEAEREKAKEQEKELDSERVKVKSFSNDIWDEDDRELYVAKKRYMEYCDQLSVPPIKNTKESRGTEPSFAEKPASSGYRYEMTERLPLFTDGRNGGRKTESYVKREMEYCEEREKKRTGQLLDKLRLSGRRLIFSFVIMLTVILLENVNVFFGGRPDGLLNGGNATIFGIVLCALLVIGAILIYDSIRDGIKCALRGVFIPESVTSLTVILAVIYHAVVAAFGGASKYSMLFGTGAAVVMFFTALYRYNMQKRDYITFSVTASYGSYLTEVKMLGFKNSPEGKAYEGYADPQSALYKMNKVARIDAPYNDNPTRDECFGLMRKLTLCIICAAVVSGVVFGLIRNDVLYGVISAISLMTFSAPVCVFVALSVPRLRASSVSAEYGGAIADFDDESDEFDTGVIMIDDGELFPPERVVSSGFEMQRSPGIEIHLARTLALFKKIGGAMSALFSNVEGTIENFDSVVITEITENGISAKIDGVSISAGSESYMEKLGIKVKKSDKLIPKNGRVMYIADGGEFFARATLTFIPDMELVKKISELRNTETLFSLKSCNPCIDKELIFYTTGLEPELLRLVKYESGDNVAPAETDREGSLVSKSGALGLLTALLEYKRQKKLVLEASRLACVSCAIGLFLSLLTSALGVNFGFSSLLMLGFHGAMSLIGFMGAHRGAINTKSKIKKK